MGLTTSLYTSLSGLSANSQAISVTGNNISNVNTTSFKGSRAFFESQISQTISAGSAPNGEFGGTNPTQVGLGTKTAAIQRNMNNGSLQPTGVNTDMAIEGNGFFVVENGGNQFYTRAGTFSLDRDFRLVNPDGARVQGFGIDSDFNIVEGVLGDVQIPLGVLSLAEATENVFFAGNLNSGGDVGTNGSIIESAALYSDAGQVNQALGTTALTSLFDGAGTQLFAAGDVLTIKGITKGGASVPEKTFEVDDGLPSDADAVGTTMDDFMQFIDDILGLDNAQGASVAMVNGQLTITGNTGTVNDIQLENSNIIKDVSGTPSLPFEFSKAQSADGESVRTTFVAYDSLGTELVVDMSFVLENKGSSGTTWRFFVQSDDDTDLDRHLHSGTAEFDTNGRFVSSTDGSFSIDRQGTGAFPIQQIDIAFKDPDGSVSALVDTPSQVTALRQDGAPLGTLEDFSVAEDGTVVGVFSNNLLRDLGRIVLANFANPQGLEEVSANLFDQTVNSGNATLVEAGTGGSGNLVGGALELSNVDLSSEFINLITASTGFSANSRVLTTSDRLIQELLSSVR